MSERRKKITVFAVHGLVAAGLGTLIYTEYGRIDEARGEAERIRLEIDSGRNLVLETPALEREVILQRETDDVVREILPNDEEITNFVRTLREFEEASGVQINSVKKKNLPTAGQDQAAFDKVAYTLTFSADAFQLLSFLDHVESHQRFMSTPDFKLTSARRNQIKEGEVPRHSVTLDVETYAYRPTSVTQPVEIESYDRKREMLLSEIRKRSSELQLAPYDFRGAEGRRDPWVDPRVPRAVDGRPVLTIEQQIDLVDELVARVEEAELLWMDTQGADNLIAEMKARSELANTLLALEEDALRIEDEGQLTFVSAERRFQKDVLGAVRELQLELADSEEGLGPSLTALEESIDKMKSQIDSQDFSRAQETFALIEPRLELVNENDELRAPLVQELFKLNHVATTVLEFSAMSIDIGGVATYEGLRPVALINGHTVSEGEMLDGELLVRSITKNEIEFVFRGLILARRFEL